MISIRSQDNLNGTCPTTSTKSLFLSNSFTTEIGGMLPGPDQVSRRVKGRNSQTKLVKNYDVCPSGCYLYAEDDNATVCPNLACGKPRYLNEEAKTPSQEMSIVSVGAALANQLYDPEVRPLFDYRKSFDHQDGEYKDIFSGEVYREYIRHGMFQGDDDIGLVIVVDGFVPKNKKTVSLTVINAYIMNINPALDSPNAL